MAITPVPAEFETIGTDVVMVGDSYSYETAPLTPGKITKVTKTQVTAEFKNATRTWTVRFVTPRWRGVGGPSMEEYGMRDSYGRGATLILATDPSIEDRKARRAASLVQAKLKKAAADLGSSRHAPTAEQVAALRKALDTYEATLTKA